MHSFNIFLEPEYKKNPISSWINNIHYRKYVVQFTFMPIVNKVVSSNIVESGDTNLSQMLTL
jgi:hypothetical protein